LASAANRNAFEREKTAVLPDDAPTNVVITGCNSDGPLVLRGPQGQFYSAGKLLFWDIDKMAVSELPRNVVGGDAIRISAGGKTLTGWTTGTNGQQFELARMTFGNVETLKSPDEQDYSGGWATPTADCSYILGFTSGIYSGNLKPLSSKAFTDEVLMPCEDPRFMLALRLADASMSSVGAAIFALRLMTWLTSTHRLVGRAREIQLPVLSLLPQRRTLRLLESAHVHIPATAGFLRPVVLLPATWP
jgi:hypothetical protein